MLNYIVYYLSILFVLERYCLHLRTVTAQLDLSHQPSKFYGKPVTSYLKFDTFTLSNLKLRTVMYIRSAPKYWYSLHSVKSYFGLFQSAPNFQQRTHFNSMKNNNNQEGKQNPKRSPTRQAGESEKYHLEYEGNRWYTPAMMQPHYVTFVAR